jgi:hypothetical protein
VANRAVVRREVEVVVIRLAAVDGAEESHNDSGEDNADCRHHVNPEEVPRQQERGEEQVHKRRHETAGTTGDTKAHICRVVRINKASLVQVKVATTNERTAVVVEINIVGRPQTLLYVDVNIISVDHFTAKCFVVRSLRPL